MFKIHFVSENEQWLQELKTQFQTVPLSSVTFSRRFMHTIPKEGSVFLSPITSYGMSESEDFNEQIQKQMFPDYRRKVTRKIKEIGSKDFITGHYCLPVGSAVLTQMGGNTAILTTATIVSETSFIKKRSIYNAFMAALLLMKKYNSLAKLDTNFGCKLKKAFGYSYQTVPFTTLVVPSMYHNLSIQDAVSEIRRAYDNFILGDVPQEHSFHLNPKLFLSLSIDAPKEPVSPSY
jgi:hypothetical protein